MYPTYTTIRARRHGPTIMRRGLRHSRRNIVVYVAASVAATVALIPSAAAAQSGPSRTTAEHL
jgi:hypothetical protein